MFYGLNNFIKKIFPKRLFYRALIIVAAPVIILQITISIVFFDSIWIKANKGMTRSLVSELKTLTDVYKTNKPLKIIALDYGIKSSILRNLHALAAAIAAPTLAGPI